MHREMGRIIIVITRLRSKGHIFYAQLGYSRKGKGRAAQFHHSCCVPGGHTDLSPVSRRNHLFPDNRAPSSHTPGPRGTAASSCSSAMRPALKHLRLHLSTNQIPQVPSDCSERRRRRFHFSMIENKTLKKCPLPPVP